MWRLKLAHLFGGYGYYVGLATLGSIMLCLMMTIGSDSALDLFVALFCGLTAPGIVVFMFQNFMPDVRGKVYSAESPDWRELEPYEYDELLAQQVKSSPALKYFLYAQIPILIISAIIAAGNGPLVFVIIEGIALAVCLSHTVITALTAGKWENVDGSARIAEIPIEETYNVTIRYKHSTETKPYYVYYLKEGRFVADADQLYSGLTVKIVRWAGSVIYLRRSTDK